MQRLESLLVPIILAVMIGALLLERAQPDTVRIVALVLGSALFVYLVWGSYRRAKKKIEIARREQELAAAAAAAAEAESHDDAAS